MGNQESLARLKKSGATHVQLLEYPHFTRPDEFEGVGVSETLLSGNHAEIELWRLKHSFEQTLKKRPDLFLTNLTK